MEITTFLNGHFVTVKIQENVFSKFTLVATLENEAEEKETITRNIVKSIEYDLLDLIENEIVETSFNHSLTVKNLINTSGLYENEYVRLNYTVTFNDNDFTVKVA